MQAIPLPLLIPGTGGPGTRVCGAAPPDGLGDFLQAHGEVSFKGPLSSPYLLAGSGEVLEADLQGVDAEGGGDDIDLGLAGPRRLRAADGAVGASGGRVGVDAVGSDLEVLVAIGARHAVGDALGDPDAVVGVGAGVHVGHAIAGDQGAVAHDAGADGEPGGVASNGLEGVLD